jgi:ATP-dependent Lhr-like helicase
MHETDDRGVTDDRPRSLSGHNSAEPAVDATRYAIPGEISRSRAGASVNPASLFHPAVADWFDRSFSAPTAAQAEAWPEIKAGRHTLIAAPTGSGKTLAAFLAAIDTLVRQGLDSGLKDQTQIVYVSPLKALSNDIQRNLEAPLAGIRDALRRQGLPEIDIRTWVRTGDTAPRERERMRRSPPHIIVTTPESLYILIGSESGRKMLATTRTVIIDEIHAVAPNKRGSHLAISLERLAALCSEPLLRIGLSATQKPIEMVARFLVGPSAECRIIDTGHRRERDLALEVPSSPLEAVMSGEVWQQVYNRLAELIEAHRTTLIFVNTRRLAERVTRQLSDRLGADKVTAHHGSLAKEQRFDAEQRLKGGVLKALVATASLELGIDIGDVDLVCQLGSPRSIASLLQRVGRSGHAVAGTPKGRLFPLSRDELVECAALIDSVRRGELDRLTIPEQPLDVLAQHIVAEVAAQEWNEDALYGLVRRAWPYRELPRADFAAVLAMLAEGFTTRRGRRGALIHYDAVNHKLRGRRGARLTALTSGGTIPDNADYQVLLEPENQIIGTVNEDFAVESMVGDVFQLGNAAYRVLRVERGTLRVEDAQGAAPNIPFWLGEAPGRSDELSQSVSRLRAEIARRFEAKPGVGRWLTDEIGITEPAAEQIINYLAAGRAALGLLPTRETLVIERFFDEVGGMQLVIHSPYGSRINRAWGLALRKRFCRKFNFELQAAATEDNIVLSLTRAHSFDLDEVPRYVTSAGIRRLVIEAVLDAPMFITRWRWVAGVSLALPRFRGGRKVPPQLTRMAAEDLIAAVFPDQVACAENLVGEREIPDHPLVRQTLADCLGEAMDVAGLETLLAGLEAGEVRVVTRDLTEPSPLALEILSARPYAYLDDAPLEERRTQAVLSRRWLGPEDAGDIGRLDPEAIAQVRDEAWPELANADELHDALVWLGFIAAAEAPPGWHHWFAELARDKRAAVLHLPRGPCLSQALDPHPNSAALAAERMAAGGGGAAEGGLWIAVERLPQFAAVYPRAVLAPPITAPEGYAERCWSREEALVEILRGRLEGSGPVGEAALAAPLGIAATEIKAALAALENEGFAMRGRFTPGANLEEWCERSLLARIHRYTVGRLRAEIQPVAARDFLCFLFAWQRVTPDTRMEGPDALEVLIRQLEGFEAPAAAWETEILPARLDGYDPAWLDEQCLAGRIAWARLNPRPPRPNGGERNPAPVRTTPIALLARRHAGLWASLLPAENVPRPTPRAQAVADVIRQYGASFFDELVEGTGLLRPQVEEALAELVALGLVTSDSFAGLRALLRKPVAGRRRRTTMFGMEGAGRWALTRRMLPRPEPRPQAVEHLARALLSRYGVVFWRLLEREAPWLPPWRDLLRVYRRLEARGEIRGGRFVAGFSGEQFALPEAVGMLRESRRKPPPGWVSLSGADPLNLVGILTPGPKLAALTGNRLLYRDGLPVALFAGGETQFLGTLDPATQWEARKALLRGAVPPALVHLV